MTAMLITLEIVLAIGVIKLMVQVNKLEEKWTILADTIEIIAEILEDITEECEEE